MLLQLIKDVLLPRRVHCALTHSLPQEGKIGAVQPHMLHQRLIPIGSVPDKLSDQPQLEADRKKEVPAHPDADEVLPGATPHAFERVDVGRPLDGADLHLDARNLEPCKILPSVGKPDRRIPTRESRQSSRSPVDIAAPDHQDVHVVDRKLDALRQSRAGADQPTIKPQGIRIDLIKEQREDVL